MERKKSNKELSIEFKEFWENYFKLNNIVNPYFSAKLLYKDSDYEEMAIRLFKSELEQQNGIYVELFNFKGERNSPRVLYLLPYNKNWEKESDDYQLRISKDGTVKTYAVKFKNLVNLSEINFEFSANNANFEVPDEFEDEHQSKMTIRDLYCIINQVPLSNKNFLNDLIKQGVKWKNQN